MEDYDFGKAVLKMNPGDELDSIKLGMSFKMAEDRRLFNTAIHTTLIEITPDLFSVNDWQIIPAKKEMVSCEEWEKLQSWLHLSDDNKVFIRSVWDTSAENRDILYTDLMEKLVAYFKTESGAALHELKLALKKVVLILV